jgi:hypothetical protein
MRKAKRRTVDVNALLALAREWRRSAARLRERQFFASAQTREADAADVEALCRARTRRTGERNGRAIALPPDCATMARGGMKCQKNARPIAQPSRQAKKRLRR